MKKAHVLLVLLLTVFVAKELLWAALVPSTDAPDELAHYSYVQTLFHDGKLPVLGVTEFYSDRPSEGGGQLNWIAQHPPLYYALLLPAYAILPHDNASFSILFLRMISILLATGTLFFAFRTMKNILPENDRMALGVTAAIAFLPMFSYISALINNDNLVIFLAMILLNLLTSRPRLGGGIGKKTSGWKIKIGLILAALALTKATTLPLFLVVLAAQIIAYIYSNLADRPKVARETMIIFAIPAVLAAWWYLRNFGLYKDFFPELKDVVALKPEILTKYHSLQIAFPEITGIANSNLSFADFILVKSFALEYFKNIWGAFGRFFVQLTDIQYMAIFGFCLVSLVGYFKKLYYGVKKNWFRAAIKSPQFIMLLTAVVMLAAITNKLFEIAKARGFLGAMQGRYFFAAILPFFYFWLRGWDHLLQERQKNYVFALLVCAFIINDITTLFAVIIPQYY